MTTSPLADAILLTLAYSDIFATPLTLPQIHQRLIGLKVSRTRLTQTLQNLLSRQVLDFRNGYYFFPDRAPIIKLHQQRQIISDLKLKQAKILAAQLASLPSILAIYLTGSLAVNNASPQADIDFLIITQINQLWTTRFLLNLFLDVRGLRRRPQDKSPQDKLCLNLFLTPQSLVLPQSKHNLHSAYELIQFQPLFERQPLQAHFYQANRWFQSYLPNFRPQPSRSKLKFKPTFNPLEPLLFQAQRLYMNSKLTNELVDRHYAYFHPQPLQPKVISQLKTRIVRYNIKLWPELQPYLD